MPARKARQALPAEVLVDAPRPGLRPELAVEYPESDGQPMAENGYQERAIMELATGLRLCFRGRDDVLVEADRIVYYKAGDASASIVPDVFVVLGVGSHPRRTYKVWEEGRPPDFVMEVASPATFGNDDVIKPRIYARMGVREYFQFDPEPEARLLTPRLQGRRLQGGSYHALRTERLPGIEASVHSEVLGLDIHFDGNELLVWDSKRGRYWSVTASERRAEAEARARRQAQEQAQAEAEARTVAEQRAQAETEARAMAEQRAQAKTEALREAEERFQAERVASERRAKLLEERLARAEAALRSSRNATG